MIISSFVQNQAHYFQLKTNDKIGGYHITLNLNIVNPKWLTGGAPESIIGFQVKIFCIHIDNLLIGY